MFTTPARRLKTGSVTDVNRIVIQEMVKDIIDHTKDNKISLIKNEAISIKNSNGNEKCVETEVSLVKQTTDSETDTRKEINATTEITEPAGVERHVSDTDTVGKVTESTSDGDDSGNFSLEESFDNSLSDAKESVSDDKTKTEEQIKTIETSVKSNSETTDTNTNVQEETKSESKETKLKDEVFIDDEKGIGEKELETELVNVETDCEQVTDSTTISSELSSDPVKESDSNTSSSECEQLTKSESDNDKVDQKGERLIDQSEKSKSSEKTTDIDEITSETVESSTSTSDLDTSDDIVSSSPKVVPRVYGKNDLVSEPIVSSTQNTQGCQTDGADDETPTTVSESVKEDDTPSSNFDNNKLTIDVSCETENFEIERQISKESVSVSTDTEELSKEPAQKRKSVDCSTLTDIPYKTARKGSVDSGTFTEFQEKLVKPLSPRRLSPNPSVMEAQPLSPTKITLKLSSPASPNKRPSLSPSRAEPTASTTFLSKFESFVNELPDTSQDYEPPYTSPGQFSLLDSSSTIKDLPKAFDSSSKTKGLPKAFDSCSKIKDLNKAYDTSSKIKDLPKPYDSSSKIKDLHKAFASTSKIKDLPKAYEIKPEVKTNTGQTKTVAPITGKRPRGRPPKNKTVDPGPVIKPKTHKSRSSSPKRRKTCEKQKKELHAMSNKSEKTASKSSDPKSQKRTLDKSESQSSSQSEEKKIPKHFVLWSNGQYTLATENNISKFKQSSPLSPTRTVFDTVLSSYGDKDNYSKSSKSNTHSSSSKHVHKQDEKLSKRNKSPIQNTLQPMLKPLKITISEPHVLTKTSVEKSSVPALKESEDVVAKPERTITSVTQTSTSSSPAITVPSVSFNQSKELPSSSESKVVKTPEYRHQSPFFASISGAKLTNPHRPTAHLNIPNLNSHFSGTHYLYAQNSYRYTNDRLGTPSFRSLPGLSSTEPKTLGLSAIASKNPRDIVTSHSAIIPPFLSPLSIPSMMHLPATQTLPTALNNCSNSPKGYSPDSTKSPLHMKPDSHSGITNSQNSMSNIKTLPNKQTTIVRKTKEKSIDNVISAITEMRAKKESNVPEQLTGMDLTIKSRNSQSTCDKNNVTVDDKNSGSKDVDKFAFTDDDTVPARRPGLHLKPEREKNTAGHKMLV